MTDCWKSFLLKLVREQNARNMNFRRTLVKRILHVSNSHNVSGTSNLGCDTDFCLGGLVVVRIVVVVFRIIFVVGDL